MFHSSRTVTQVIAPLPFVPERIVHLTLEREADAEEISLSVPEKPVCDYVAAIDQLSEILITFQAERDILSERMHVWGKKVLRAVIAHRNDPLEKIEQIAQTSIQELGKEILINPIDRSPLHDPVIERGWTWERSLRESYRTLFPTSPLDNQPWSVEPFPHLFAEKMLAWMQQTFPSVLSKNSGQVAEPCVALQALTPACCVVYKRLAHNAVMIAQNRRMQAMMAGALVQFDQTMADIRQKDRVVVQAAEKRAAEHEAALQEKIDVINRTHEETLASLNAQISVLQARYQENIASLEAQMNSIDQTNAALLASYQQQMSALRKEHECSISSLTQQIRSAEQDRQQTVTRMQSQLEHTVRLTQDALDTVGQSHARQVSDLRGQIDESDRRIGLLRERLHEAEERTMEHEADISRLQGNLAVAHQQIAQLRAEVASSGDDSCSVM